MSFTTPPPGGFEAMDAGRDAEKKNAAEGVELNLHTTQEELLLTRETVRAAVAMRAKRTGREAAESALEHMITVLAVYQNLIRGVHGKNAESVWAQVLALSEDLSDKFLPIDTL